MKCIGPNCERDARCRSMCSAHYKQHHEGKTLKELRPRNKRAKPPAGYEDFAWCNDCGNLKPLTQFYMTQSGKPRSRCAKCLSIDNNSRAKRKKESA